uniref:Bm10398, isoform b n=2 Tax=Brugia malayi TaxID=6279 RepID=A0A1I9G3H6_BRUMA|nr:Bm10398, isoform b [Brugia malayi]
MVNDYVIYQIFWLITFCLLQGTPLRCDMSLLLEYLNQKDYEYYLGVGYADSCVSTMVKIESDFRVENMLTIVQSLHGLHFYKQSKVIMHEPAVIRALQAQDIRCSFGNMHPVLIGLDLNVTIIVNFDSTTNQLTIVVAQSVRNQPTHFRYFYRDQVSRLVSGYTDIFLTTIDMGRGLLHFVHQNNNDSLHTGHEVLQIKTIDSGMRIMKIRSEEIHMKFSQLLMDPSGTYAFYTVPEKNKQQSVYQMKVDYPNFTLDAQKTSQEKAKIFAVNQDDRILPVDRNALVVWKFAGEKRSAWLYEGSCTGSSQRKKSFHQIGCILSGINDPTGRLSIKIHRIRRHL